MGQLIPEDFPIESLANDEERLVVRALVEQLSDDWHVIADVGMADSERDRQTDIVIAHHRDGVAVIEVKGHKVSIDHGIWKAHGSPMSPQPLAQAKDNAYALRSRLRATHPSLSRLEVAWAVALPNTTEIVGRLPIEIDRRQVLTCDRIVIEECDRLIDHEGHAPSRVLVATFSSEVRDHLRADHAFVRWEDADDRTIICETVHRSKGLEFDYVVLAATNNDMSDAQLYVGVSRAITGLTVIGPKSLADRLGLDAL